MRESGTVRGFVAQDPGARSQFTVFNTVTSQFIPAANPAEPNRGTITVTSRSVYSLRKVPDNADDEPVGESSAQGEPFGPLDDSEDADSGIDVMDSELISASPDGSKVGAATVESVQRRADEDVRTYELAQENGRWVLKTKLDPETEKSIENAFGRALRLQP